MSKVYFAAGVKAEFNVDIQSQQLSYFHSDHSVVMPRTSVDYRTSCWFCLWAESQDPIPNRGHKISFVKKMYEIDILLNVSTDSQTNVLVFITSPILLNSKWRETVITSLTYCIHLPTRLLGDYQVCLGPVCQCPHHFPLGLWACKKICFSEPNCIHHPSTNDKTSPVMIEWNHFPPFTFIFTFLTFFYHVDLNSLCHICLILYVVL